MVRAVIYVHPCSLYEFNSSDIGPKKAPRLADPCRYWIHTHLLFQASRIASYSYQIMSLTWNFASRCSRRMSRKKPACQITSSQNKTPPTFIALFSTFATTPQYSRTLPQLHSLVSPHSLIIWVRTCHKCSPSHSFPPSVAVIPFIVIIISP